MFYIIVSAWNRHTPYEPQVAFVETSKVWTL